MMRKNLTISLNQEDWTKIQVMARSLGETYSGVFHRLIEGGAGTVRDRQKIEKYRNLLGSSARFLGDRAGAFAKAGRLGRRK